MLLYLAPLLSQHLTYESVATLQAADVPGTNGWKVDPKKLPKKGKLTTAKKAGKKKV